jgi:hypothetical protein
MSGGGLSRYGDSTASARTMVLPVGSESLKKAGQFQTRQARKVSLCPYVCVCVCVCVCVRVCVVCVCVCDWGCNEGGQIRECVYTNHTYSYVLNVCTKIIQTYRKRKTRNNAP